VRDAVRAADERFATGTHLMVQIPLPPVSRGEDPNGPASEHTSDALLTKMSTGIKEPMLSDARIGSTTLGTSPSIATPPRGSGGPTSQAPVESHSLTQHGVSVGPNGQRARRTAPVVVTLAVAVAILGFAGFRTMRLRAAQAARWTVTAAPTASAPFASPTPSGAPVQSAAATTSAPPPSASAAVIDAGPARAETRAAPVASVATVVAPRAGWTSAPPAPPPLGPPPRPGPGKHAEERMDSKGGAPIYTNPGF
jgi:hypothetical protein